jgi:excisionase family DNA binding protein
MTLIQAAAILGVTASTLRQQIAKGKLTATKMGRDWFVTLDEVERYRAESRRAPSGAVDSGQATPRLPESGSAGRPDAPTA